MLKNLFSALNEIKDHTAIFTLPNSDLNSDIITEKIKYFCKTNKNAFYFKNLGHVYFKSVLKVCDAIIGNSSSGMIEVPSLGIPTINIGLDKQVVKEHPSIIDCKIDKKKILNAIYKSQKLNLKKKYYQKKQKVFVPKNSSNKVYNKVLDILKTKIHFKEFVDIIK